MPFLDSHPAVAELRRLWRPLAMLIAIAAWFSTWQASSALAAVIHYGALLALGAIFIFWLAGTSPRRNLVLAVGVAGCAMVLMTYLWRDTYIVRWEDRDGSKYVDTRRRLGGAVEYRRAVRRADEGLAWSEGPMQQGEPHGHWLRHETRPPRTVSLWFWQGKPVSEAEWQKLRGG
jgi:hypothetical protein